MTVEYPPLTPLDAMPLHPPQGGIVYACRGGDSYDWRCPACVDHAAAQVAAGRDLFQSMRLYSDDNEPHGYRLSYLVARSRALLS